MTRPTTPVDSRLAEAIPGAAPAQDVFVYGLPLWNATYEEFFAWWVGVMASADRRCYVMPIVNANTLNVAKRVPELMQALRDSDLLIMDGIGMRLACQMRGVPMRENLNGTDLIPRMFGETPVPVRVFLYGATEESNRRTAENLERRFPMVKIVGRRDGYGDPEAVVSAIAQAEPDLTLVAMGHPKQELFCIRNRARLNTKLIVPVGGLFDFLSEMKPRAPKLLRDLGLEWMYRLALEPKRLFARYVYGNPVFLVRSALAAAKDREQLKRKREPLGPREVMKSGEVQDRSESSGV